MHFQEFITGQIIAVFLVFCRIGSALMFIPGFGEAQVPARVRLVMALVLSFALSVHTPVPSAMPDGFDILVLWISGEIIVGLWIGLSAKIILSSLQFAGQLAGQTSALANAFAPGMGSFEGATVISSFLMIAGVAMVFISNVHHLMIEAFIKSYALFPVGDPLIGDMTDQLAKVVSHSMTLGFSMGAPFLVMGMTANIGMGLANRVMPTLPVFFVATSVLIMSGIFLMALASGSILMAYLDAISTWLIEMKL